MCIAFRYECILFSQLYRYGLILHTSTNFGYVTEESSLSTYDGCIAIHERDSLTHRSVSSFLYDNILYWAAFDHPRLSQLGDEFEIGLKYN